MATCPDCGSVVMNGDSHCPHCGVPLIGGFFDDDSYC